MGVAYFLFFQKDGTRMAFESSELSISDSEDKHSEDHTTSKFAAELDAGEKPLPNLKESPRINIYGFAKRNNFSPVAQQFQQRKELADDTDLSDVIKREPRNQVLEGHQEPFLDPFNVV